MRSQQPASIHSGPTPVGINGMTSTFNILDHIDKLTLAGREKDRYLCPVCGGNDFTVQSKGENAGAYQCWSGQCKPTDIREAVSPLEKVEPQTQRRIDLAKLNKSDKKNALAGAEVRAKAEDLAFMVSNGAITEGDAIVRLSAWAKDERHDVYGAKKVLGDILATLGTSGSTDDDDVSPESLRTAIESYAAESDPFQRALLQNEIGKTFGVRNRMLDDLVRVVISPNSGSTASMDEAVHDVFGEIELRAQNGEPIGLHSGFADLDRMTQGFQASDLVIVAGRPAMGKTAFALGCAAGVASQGKKVLIFSLEMSQKQLTYRLLSCMASIPSGVLRTGKLSPDEWNRLGVATASLSNLNISINDVAEQTVAEIERVCDEEQPDMVVIDYCTLLDGPGTDGYQKVTYNTKKLKVLARKLNIPILLLSQLSRAVEQRQNKRPISSDLRDSGSVEQDADLILMLYREEYYDEETAARGIAEVIICKHRNGPTGTVKLLFEQEFTRFRNLSPAIG